MRPHILSGFYQASAAGPLCEEPMRGIAFILHSATGSEEEEAAVVTANPYGPMSGQVMVATKDSCRYCLLRKGFSRISEAPGLAAWMCASLGHAFGGPELRARDVGQGLRRAFEAKGQGARREPEGRHLHLLCARYRAPRIAPMCMSYEVLGRHSKSIY